MYENLTQFIPLLDGNTEYGEVIVDREHKGTVDDPIQWPFIAYSDTVLELEQAIYAFHKAHSDYELTRYAEILERNSLKWDMRSMTDADVDRLDGQAVMALLMGAIRAERFCDGALLNFCESGAITRWLRRLDELDG